MSKQEHFHVEPWVDYVGSFIQKHRQFFIKLGNLETSLLSDTIAQITLDKPIYIAGLARSGTTIMLEMLAEHEGVVTHRYKDYPPVYIPYWWNWYLSHVPAKKRKAVERSHKDGILITPDSPEAMEEVLWMSFFPDAHNPHVSNLLDLQSSNEKFEDFYTAHIKKLLAVRGGSRYLSKGNYNISRLAYIQSIFPTACFIIPIRSPVGHVASLMKQHKLFCEGMRSNLRAVEHLRRVGHFEFGLDLRPINFGDNHMIGDIQQLWRTGQTVRAWSRYWSYIYGAVLDQLDNNIRLKAASLVVTYEDLCSDSVSVLQAVLEHCDLPAGMSVIEKYADKLRVPDYYTVDFTSSERNIIKEETQTVAARYGLSYDGKDS